MLAKRIIARLDVKGPNVVKGIHMEGLRVMGNPHALAVKYYEDGTDEILYIDTVASLYGRNNLLDIVKETTDDVFIPVTVGGGIRSLDDIRAALRAGADKVAINTAAVKCPHFITEAVKIFGAQAIVGSIEAKRVNAHWEAYTDNGRNKTGLDAVQWATRLEQLGCGELLLTSIDADGKMIGADMELFLHIHEQHLSIPVVGAGGFCSPAGIECYLTPPISCDAVAIGAALHYNRITIKEIKQYLLQRNILVRTE